MNHHPRVTMAGVVAVDRKGVLALLTSDTKAGSFRAIDAAGQARVVDRPIVLGRLGDWLASGRTFPAWAKDRGYQGVVDEATGNRFLVEAERRRIL